MVELHALVNHRHNHVRIACLKSPCRPDIGIRTREALPSEDRAGVVVVPLLLLHVRALIERKGVLPRHLSLCRSRLLRNGRERSESVLLGHSNLHRALDALNRAAAPELAHHSRCFHGLVEACHIPAVKPLGLCPRLEFPTFRKQPLKAEASGCAENLRNLVGSGRHVLYVSARLCCRHGSYLNQKFALHDLADALVDDNRPANLRLLLHRLLLRAGRRHGEHRKKERGKMSESLFHKYQ